MKETDILRIQQLEDNFKPLRRLRTTPPVGGWLRAIREAMGMTNVQLAARLGRKAPQTVEDIQKSEAAGTARLDSLRELAEAMGCRLVYAIVPDKPIMDVLRNRATEVARHMILRTSHTMKLEAQEVNANEEQRALARQVDKLLRGHLKRLWD